MNYFVLYLFLSDGRKSERELERGKGIEWIDVSIGAMILQADSHDVSLVKNIIVTGPLCTSESGGECRLSANLCKRALDVTADVNIEAS